MIPYKDLGGDSGVSAFAVEAEAIIVRFKRGKHTHYKYTYSSAGSHAVEKMKILACAGKGLNSFIGTSKPPYHSKW